MLEGCGSCNTPHNKRKNDLLADALRSLLVPYSFKLPTDKYRIDLSRALKEFLEEFFGGCGLSAKLSEGRERRTNVLVLDSNLCADRIQRRNDLLFDTI